MSSEGETKGETKETKESSTVPAEKKELTGPYSWIILGGVGFIGRHFAKFLVDNNYAKQVRVTDKAHWAMSMMNDEHKSLFSSKTVEYMQADLTKKDHVERVMNQEFDFVVNCCGETRPNIPEEEIRMRAIDPVVNCIEVVKTWKSFKKWVEVSTAQVYDSDNSASTEATPMKDLKPWTYAAQCRLEAEKLVRGSGLPHVVVRPAIVYGPADTMGIMPRLCCAAVYQKLGETMTFMWTEKLKINTVHVKDVAKALYYVATKPTSGYNTFNLADRCNFDQGKLNAIISKLFGIKTDFLGTIKSHLARLSLKSACDAANEAHMPVWSGLLKDHGILNTPLSTYISLELLYNNSLCVDGTYICTVLDFQYDHPECNEAEIRDMINYAAQQGILPDGLLKN